MDLRPDSPDDSAGNAAGDSAHNAAGVLVHGFHDPAALPAQVEASRRAADAARRFVAGVVVSGVDSCVLDRVWASLVEAAVLV
ncbi:MAG: hypothetical protein ACKOVH_08760 [Actinomycetota bacterium]